MNYKIFIVSLFAATTAMAQSTMTVHMKDGSVTEFNMDNVEYVEMLSRKSAVDTIPVIGGIIAEEIDLGLSVRWASHNVGAMSSTQSGFHTTWVDAPVATEAWGNGWSLPTKDEWQELIDKCSWSWTVRDGIGGRLVTGPSGKSIFLPASGVEMNQQLHILGTTGLYWTSSMPSDTSDSEKTKNSTAMCFDSGNIYQMAFPVTNLFTIRPVKR